ncbi:MAG TPA: CDF family Co(II)/Ni(II) efflux transporter DmeF [Caulobacteraceae bacterium]|jgi:cation diffusion facilitator family transporter|nr:CDF family Co(II)/Ni(II) efflux transporter DmeF [Caulobacteraceae bacterium]
MTSVDRSIEPMLHSLQFPDQGGQGGEKAWAVIWLCGAMMLFEMIGGLMFGSIALVGDGLHMSTYAGAPLMAAVAYAMARRNGDDARFTFGTGKLGELAGFASAIILAMIALLTGYESVSRVFRPVPIRFTEAIPIACLGLVVNIAGAWLLRRDRENSRGAAPLHGQSHGHREIRRIVTNDGVVAVEICEGGAPARFRMRAETGPALAAGAVALETVRASGERQSFIMADRGGFLESLDEVPEPHAFDVLVRLGEETVPVAFEEVVKDPAGARVRRDNTFRAAVIHVLADAAVSVFVIFGLVIARVFGWLWMDPVAGAVGACVIFSWSIGVIRDTGAILLDMNPDRDMAQTLRAVIETDGDRLADLRLWRLGQGHLGAIVSVRTCQARDQGYYRAKLAGFRSLSHLTIEVQTAS